ncbi:MAG TPA: hypothetical protein VNI84_20720 [Pyrinomonadaceae bacterium]|nr:hypothetical protein [Pyrinomonadaceae bacterium]
MNRETRDEQLAEWVKNWQTTGIELEKIRREKIRNEQTSESILAFSDASASVLLHNPPSATSGLVELQKWFKLLRKANDTDS